MRLIDARQYLKEVDSKGYWYLKSWGLSTIRESIYTVRNRQSSTKQDLLLAENVNNVIMRGW